MLSISALQDMKPISADSHIVEPPDIFLSRIDSKYRDICPHGVDHETRGALYIVEGISPVAVGGAASAGIPADQLKLEGRTFGNLHRGGWDPKARVADMDRDGVFAELIYPSVGMAICDVPDFDYKRACMQAYNRWLEEFCAGLPNRLFGVGQSAARDPDSMVEDFIDIKQKGFKAVMIPGEPGVEDYDSPIYDKVWATAVELDLPVSLHILIKRTKEGNAFNHGKMRGGKLNGHMMATRMLQDVVGVFMFGGVFDRHPKLKLISVEADAGWVPHFVDRAEHFYHRHRHWLQGKELKRLPSEVFRENVWFTFQDDRAALQAAKFGLLNPDMLLWASDYPHSDSTWPDSLPTLAKTSDGIDPGMLRRIVHDNTRDLFKLTLN